MNDIGLIVICAVRYALGRMSYIPYVVRQFVYNNISLLSIQEMYIIKKDIEEAESNNMLGLDSDKREWIKLKDWLKKEIDNAQDVIL